MKPARFRITGPDRVPYRLGMPMHIHEGPLRVGVIDPVPVQRGGSEVHLEHFVPTHAADYRKRQIGRLMLAEVVSFIVENFTQVQAISFTLGRDIGDTSTNDRTQRASTRSALLQRMGASHVLSAPKPDAAQEGHFVVTGIWEYNPASVAALAEVLRVERELCAGFASMPRSVPSRLGSWTRRLLPRPRRQAS
ncbi:MAG: hypothetical protein KKC85_03340 [Gammaproteobacteria bacterium]|nr:hypothetical protein [Gammaproteobacteria bacterium]MBU2285452.1 hypothetical protein [Gammaproteobacteria bacterium]